MCCAAPQWFGHPVVSGDFFSLLGSFPRVLGFRMTKDPDRGRSVSHKLTRHGMQQG